MREVTILLALLAAACAAEHRRDRVYTPDEIGLLQKPLVRFPGDRFIGVGIVNCGPPRHGYNPLGTGAWDDIIQGKPFAIDRSVVSCADYSLCARAGACTSWSPTRASWCLDDEANVTYDQAAAFCHWRGLQLASRDEWERAARGLHGALYDEQACPSDPMRTYRPTRCTTKEGFMYTLVTWGEWTRSVDCVPPEDPTHDVGHVAIALGTRLDLVDPNKASETLLSFRCVKDDATSAATGR